MARFPRTGFSALSFPSFRGVTSQLVLANVAVFFLLAAHGIRGAAHGAGHSHLLFAHPVLLLHGWVWQLATYSFLNAGVLHVAFNMLTLWFIGSFLETSKGSRWLLEIYFLCAIGGGLIGSALSFTMFFIPAPSPLPTAPTAPSSVCWLPSPRFLGTSRCTCSRCRWPSKPNIWSSFTCSSRWRSVALRRASARLLRYP
jgi:membrane associated rhomboid family serine protease